MIASMMARRKPMPIPYILPLIVTYVAQKGPCRLYFIASHPLIFGVGGAVIV